MDDRTLRERIDACRPGSNDLDQPEMADVARLLEKDARVRQLYLSVQRNDESLAAAFRDVSVPAGFEGRILAAMAENGGVPAMYGAEPAPLEDPKAYPPPVDGVTAAAPGRRPCLGR